MHGSFDGIGVVQLSQHPYTIDGSRSCLTFSPVTIRQRERCEDMMTAFAMPLRQRPAKLSPQLPKHSLHPSSSLPSCNANTSSIHLLLGPTRPPAVRPALQSLTTSKGTALFSSRICGELIAPE